MTRSKSPWWPVSNSSGMSAIATPMSVVGASNQRRSPHRPRMDDGLEVAAGGGVGEDEPAERLAIERAVRRLHRAPKRATTAASPACPGSTTCASQHVGVDRRRAERRESGEAIRLAGRNAAGERDAPRRPREVVGHLAQDAGRNLRLGVGGRRDALFDERVPLVAVRALPEEFGAAIPAAHAHVRIEVEHRLARDLDVARDQRAAAGPAPTACSRSPGEWPARADCARAPRTAGRAPWPAGPASCRCRASAARARHSRGDAAVSLRQRSAKRDSTPSLA